MRGEEGNLLAYSEVGELALSAKSGPIIYFHIAGLVHGRLSAEGYKGAHCASGATCKYVIEGELSAVAVVFAEGGTTTCSCVNLVDHMRDGRDRLGLRGIPAPMQS